MPKPILIEVAGEPVGVVVRRNDRYRFLAVKLEAFDYDGREFDSVADARLVLGAIRTPEALAS